ENKANKFAGPKEANNSAGTQANDDQGANSKEIGLYDEDFVLLICTPISIVGPSISLNDDEPLYHDDPSMPHLKDIYASPRNYMPSGPDVEIDYSKFTYGPKQTLADESNSKPSEYASSKSDSSAETTTSMPAPVDNAPKILYPKFPNKVYKVVKALYGLHQALRACVKTVSTPIETQKPLIKDEEVANVDVHLYRFQVTPKTLHLQALKRIFRYLKVQPKLGLWYPKVSAFDLESYSDSDYAGANLDKKSTTRGCQFLGRRLISWQCKKQTIMATSTTEAEYVAAAHCCRQFLWIQNQLLDYGFNLMNTKIYIDNESTICIVKNPVFHSKTNPQLVDANFWVEVAVVRDANEKNLIQVLKIHTDENVADLLTKAFDGPTFHYLTSNATGSIGVPTGVKQFWATATVRTLKAGHSEIIATINGNEVMVTESLIRTQL
nr:putative ribonuclease H-like domain-containing protein [Tanacetum cinerariifolium]